MGRAEWCMFLILLTLFSATPAVTGAVWTEEDKIGANPPVDFADFGTAVAIGGTIAVVGAPDDDTAAFAAGAAYVFERASGSLTWIQVRRLTASDVMSNRDFGASVDISGDTIVVGDPVSGDSGAVYVFERDAGGTNNWGETRRIAAVTNIGADLGTSVSIWGDVLAAGAPDDDEAGSSAGTVFVFERNEGGTGNWGETARLTASDSVNSVEFGDSIDLNRTTLIVGDYLGDDVINNVGLTYIFEKGAGWTESARLTALEPQGAAQFGAAVGVRCGIAVVGEPDYDEDGTTSRGAAHVFVRNGAWVHSQVLLASVGESFDEFGEGIAVGNGFIAVGDGFSDSPSADQGAVYVFEPDPGGSWLETIKLATADGSSADLMGGDVSASGRVLIAGARGDKDFGNNAGSAYIFSNLPWIFGDGFECGDTTSWSSTDP